MLKANQVKSSVSHCLTMTVQNQLLFCCNDTGLDIARKKPGIRSLKSNYNQASSLALYHTSVSVNLLHRPNYRPQSIHWIAVHMSLDH
jgi:hypothetical protein